MGRFPNVRRFIISYQGVPRSVFKNVIIKQMKLLIVIKSHTQSDGQDFVIEWVPFFLFRCEIFAYR